MFHGCYSVLLFLLYYRFDKHFVTHHDLVNTWLFVLVEAEADHVSFLEVVIVEVFGQLLLSSLVVRLSSPDLEFDNVLLPEIVDDNVRSGQVACLCLTVIIAYAVDDRAKVGEENLSTIVLHELVIISRTVELVEVNAESLQEMAHIDNAIVDELVLLIFAKLIDGRWFVLRNIIIVQPGLEYAAGNLRCAHFFFHEVEHDGYVDILIVIVERHSLATEYNGFHHVGKSWELSQFLLHIIKERIALFE